MKIRLLMNKAPTDWHCQNGPSVADSNDIYFLQHEPWLEIKSTSISQCKKDNVIPWVRSGGRGALLEAEKNEWPILLGPNVVFANSDNPKINLPEINSPYLYKLLMLDYTNINLAKQHSKQPEKIKQVRHFMRPELYEEPYFFKHDWDIYFHVKGGTNKDIVFYYQNHTATHNGFYKFKELKYKAQHSKVCYHTCSYENYGLAIHEISLLGCPMIYDKTGMKPGSICEGIGVEVDDIVFSPFEEIKDAIEKTKQMDRKKVWETSREFQNPEKLKKQYYNAIFGE